MRIILDESGDLGWTFDKPNGNGGSSRFITIAGIAVDEQQFKYVKRYISDLYQKYGLTLKLKRKGAVFPIRTPLTLQQIYPGLLIRLPALM